MAFSFRADDARDAFSIRLSTCGPSESRNIAIGIYDDEKEEIVSVVELNSADAMMLSSVIAEMIRVNAIAWGGFE